VAVADATLVGRRFSAPSQLVDAGRVRAMAEAIAGGEQPPEPDAVPPTFAAVYCVAPALAKVFTDPEVQIDLAGLIHGEQAFEWPVPVRAGDIVDSTAEITAVDNKRGMTLLSVAFEATRQRDAEVVCRGRSLLIVRGRS
jgi:hypothetical protein